MSKGIIYIMTSVLPGLIKIGKTGYDQFEKRMDFLEKNGYRNITGLKRKFAIEVEEYDEKAYNSNRREVGCFGKYKSK